MSAKGVFAENVAGDIEYDAPSQPLVLLNLALECSHEHSRGEGLTDSGLSSPLKILRCWLWRVGRS